MRNMVNSEKSLCNGIGRFAVRLVACVVLSMSCIATASTATDSSGNRWTYRLCTGGCEIYGTCSSGIWTSAVSLSSGGVPSGPLSIPEKLDGYSVVSIGDHALYWCQYLTGLTIPSGVKSIHPYAFLGCTGLSSFTVDAGNSSYVTDAEGLLMTKDCRTLVAVPGGKFSVTVPSSVTSIGPSAFSGGLLKGVEIPSGVTSIGECAFAYCPSLASVTISAAGTDVGIGDMAFAECQSLREACIPSRVKSIGEYAFAGHVPNDSSSAASPCLRVVYVSRNDTDRVKGMFIASRHDIEGVAFVEQDEYGNMYTEIDGCKWSYRLNDDGRTVSIACKGPPPGNPEPAIPQDTSGALSVPWLINGCSVVNIEQFAMNSRAGITDVTIPNGVTNIGFAAFAWCSSLTNVTLSSTVRKVGNCAFQGCGLVTLNIPDEVTSIGESAFSDCTRLTRVKIPLGVTSIESCTFANCHSLTSVTIPSSVTTVSSDAFSGVDLGRLAIHVLPGNVSAMRQVLSNSGYTESQINSITFVQGDGNGMDMVSGCTWYYRIVAGRAVLGRNLDNEDASFDHIAVSPEPAGSLAIPDYVHDGNNTYGVSGIGYLAFKACRDLTSVSIPMNITNVNPYAFIGCTGLRLGSAFSVHSLNRHYKATSGILLTYDGATLVAFPGGESSATFPDGVTRIGAAAFNSSMLEGSVQIPAAVTVIGECAFAYCMGLTNVEIPDGGPDVYIGGEAFAMCANLKSARIPSRVKGIGNEAFNGSGLKTVYVSSGDAGRVKDMFIASRHDVEGIAFIEPDGSMLIVADSSAPETVVVAIPDGVDPSKVTVIAAPTSKIQPNGAKVRVANGENDITEYLDIPPADTYGVIDLGAATVKEEFVNEVFDDEKGADIDLASDNPSIKTAPTRRGLTYSFSEGTSLDGMELKEQKLGDGTAFEPTISVKRSMSPRGFYSIRVTK